MKDFKKQTEQIVQGGLPSSIQKRSPEQETGQEEEEQIQKALRDNASTIWTDPKRVAAELSGKLMLPTQKNNRKTFGQIELDDAVPGFMTEFPEDVNHINEALEESSSLSSGRSHDLPKRSNHG